MMDEVARLDEEIRKGRLGREVFDYLRHLMQHHERLNFIYSIGSSLEDMKKDYALLFTVALYHPISFLEDTAARKLISEPVRDYYQITPEAVTRILQVASGHPYYTQLVCRCLFDLWVRSQASVITVTDVDAVLVDAIELGSANLTYVWEDSLPAERAVMVGMTAAMRGGKSHTNIAQIKNSWRQFDISLPERQVTHALRSLTNREVIAGNDARSFTVDLLRLWLDKHQRLDWVKEELANAVPTEAGRVRALMFEGVPYWERKALAKALARSWNQAVRRYFVTTGTAASQSLARQALQEWLKQFRDTQAVDVEGLYELLDHHLPSPSLPPDVKLLALIQWLDPDLPPAYRGQSLNREHLAAIAEQVAIDDDSASELRRLVSDLHKYDLLPQLARMRGGTLFTEVNARWRELDARFQQHARSYTPDLPENGRQMVTDPDNFRTQAALLLLALEPPAHYDVLRQHTTRYAEMPAAQVTWFDRILADAQANANPMSDVLLIILFPLATRESAAADQARRRRDEAIRQREEAIQRGKEHWAERERQRLARPTLIPRALAYCGIVVGGMVVLFSGAIATVHSFGDELLNGLGGLVVAGLLIATEVHLAKKLGSDYALYGLLVSPGSIFRRVGRHIHGVGRGFLFLIGAPLVLGIALSLPVIVYAAIGGIHMRSWNRRRKSWLSEHEQERRRTLGV